MSSTESDPLHSQKAQYFQLKESVECVQKLQPFLESMHPSDTLLISKSKSAYFRFNVTLYQLTHSEKLNIEAKARSDQVAEESSTLDLLKESLQETCGSASLA